jgi:hypothetical protein
MAPGIPIIDLFADLTLAAAEPLQLAQLALQSSMIRRRNESQL